MDKTDLKRCSYFVHRKAYDLLQIELEPMLESRTQLPPLDLEYGETRLRSVGVWWSVAPKAID